MVLPAMQTQLDELLTRLLEALMNQETRNNETHAEIRVMTPTGGSKQVLILVMTVTDRGQVCL